MGTSSGTYELNHNYSKFIHALKHGYIFFFNSNTTVPRQCVALVFLKAYVDRMSSG